MPLHGGSENPYEQRRLIQSLYSMSSSHHTSIVSVTDIGFQLPMGDFNGYVNSADKTGDTKAARHSETINEVSELNE